MNAFGVVSLRPEWQQPRETYRSGHYTCHEGRFRYTSFLAKNIAAVTKGPILDVGCGAGHLLSAFATTAIPAVGFDISPEAVVLASADPRVKVLRHDANDEWPFPAESFGAVTMFDVIEHLPRYELALEEAWRVLKPRGFLFLVTVNRSSVLRVLLGRHWGALRDPEHVIYFDRRLLTSALVRKKFAIQEFHTFFNLGIAGESAEFLRTFRVPGLMFFCPEFGDSLYVRGQKQ